MLCCAILYSSIWLASFDFFCLAAHLTGHDVCTPAGPGPVLSWKIPSVSSLSSWTSCGSRLLHHPFPQNGATHTPIHGLTTLPPLSHDIRFCSTIHARDPLLSQVLDIIIASGQMSCCIMHQTLIILALREALLTIASAQSSTLRLCEVYILHFSQICEDMNPFTSSFVPQGYFTQARGRFAFPVNI